jgi:hypothetical protein
MALGSGILCRIGGQTRLFMGLNLVSIAPLLMVAAGRPDRPAGLGRAE